MRNARFHALLKWDHSLCVLPGEGDRVEKMADNMLVNDTLIDNRLSDVHTVCNFCLLSREESRKVKSARITHLCLRTLFGFVDGLLGMRMLFSLTFLTHPLFSIADSGPVSFRNTPNLFC